MPKFYAREEDYASGIKKTGAPGPFFHMNELFFLKTDLVWTPSLSVYPPARRRTAVVPEISTPAPTSFTA
jgi:hypothetical protein